MAADSQAPPSPAAGHEMGRTAWEKQASLIGNTGLPSLLWRLLWGSGKPHVAGVYSRWTSSTHSFPDPTPGSLASEGGSLGFLPFPPLSSSSFPLFLRLSLPVSLPREPHFYLVCRLPQLLSWAPDTNESAIPVSGWAALWCSPRPNYWACRKVWRQEC